MATVDDKKVIFSMVGVSKTIQQNQKQVLKNIYLSFFYGAKCHKIPHSTLPRP